jgi:hypothetical protein
MRIHFLFKTYVWEYITSTDHSRAKNTHIKLQRNTVTLLHFLKDNPAVPQIIWFGDEAHLHLNNYMNKQNTNMWASDHPHNMIQTLLNTKREGQCRVLCQQVVMLGQLFISMSSKMNFFHFSKEWVLVSEELLYSRMSFGHTHCKYSGGCA